MTLSFANLKQKYGAFQVYLGAIALLTLGAAVGFKLGNEMHQWQERERARVEQTLVNIDDENNRLNRDLNIMRVELDVQRLANEQAQQAMAEGMQRESELRKQLSFYQKVMAPELAEKGFVVESLTFDKTLSDGVYGFELVVMQLDPIKSVIKGSIEVELIGSSNGKPARHTLKNLLVDGSDALAFSFRYFQVISGQIRLPEGFTPENADISAEIFQFKRKRGDYRTTLEWSLEES